MDKFADIRPYKDAEFRPVINRLLDNREFLTAVGRLRFPRLGPRGARCIAPLVRWFLHRQLAGVNDVSGGQRVLKRYVDDMLQRTTSGLTVSGLEQLDPSRAYLFLSNHRDIAMDPVCVNYTLYCAGHQSVRIAIGDNLLSKDYASDLMRINKSFIVNRSVQGPRQMLAAFRLLSAYISHSLHDERVSVWMAQREGRAKDGFDETEPAIIKMLAMSQDKRGGQSFPDFIRSLAIVPVAISYQYDPLDEAKARELAVTRSSGSYQKLEHEDVQNIARGIAGYKGAIHVAYGEPLSGDFSGPEDVAGEIDRQIIENYRLHPSNYAAYRAVKGEPLSCPEHDADPTVAAEDPNFERRLARAPAELRPLMLEMYSNCVFRKQGLGFCLPEPA